MTATSTKPVQVFWGRADDPDLLRRAVAAVLDVPPGDVREHRLCPRCGSSEHGRPLVSVAGRPAPHVSISRHDGHAVVAVCSDARVGVDVDASTEPDWVRREAAGKARGVGIVEDVGEPAPPLVMIGSPPGTVAAVALDHREAPAVVTRAGPAAPDR